MGDEQFIDVELDRNTELLPRCEDTWTVDWRSESEKKRAARRDVGTGSASSKVSDPRELCSTVHWFSSQSSVLMH